MALVMTIAGTALESEIAGMALESEIAIVQLKVLPKNFQLAANRCAEIICDRFGCAIWNIITPPLYTGESDNTSIFAKITDFYDCCPNYDTILYTTQGYRLCWT